MTINCPGCGKTFPQEDHAYYGHLSSCQKMRDIRAAEKFPRAKPTPTAAGQPPAESSGTSAPGSQAPISGKERFYYAKEKPIQLGPLEITPTAAPGAAPLPGQPLAPGPPTLPAAGEMLRDVFKTFGTRWNAWLEAEPGQPTVDAAKWTESDTELAVNTFNAIDRKYGIGTIANWAPELLVIALIANIATKTLTGLRAKGVLRGGPRLPGSKGTTVFSNPREEKDAAEAWEAELKARGQQGGEPKT